MIIDRLLIRNFKNYSDENIFDWTMSDDRNVILIGGMNGAGKTTISEAIRLCLYGHKMSGIPMSESKYQRYINTIWSKTRRNEPIIISMDVTLDAENPPIRMTVSRTFKNVRGKIVEDLSLTKDGKDVELIDKNYWEYYVSKILPPHLTRYFFFDGEMVRDTIASDNSSEYLFNAIKDLTGVSKLEVLKTDLFEVRKRISHTNIKPSVGKKIRNLEGRIEKILSEVESLNVDRQTCLDTKVALIDKKHELEDEFNRALGIKEDIIKDLKRTIDQNKQRLNELNDFIHEFVYTSYPRIICKNVLESTLSVAKEENDINMSNLNGGYIKERFTKLKASLGGLSLSKDVLRSIFDAIDTELKEVESMGSDFRTPIIDLTYNQIDSMRSETYSEDDVSLFINRLRERENVSRTIAKMEKEVRTHSDESAADMSTDIATVDENISSLNNKLIEFDALIKSKTEEVESIRKEIYEEEKSLVLTARDNTALKVIDEVVSDIDLRIEVQLTNRVHELEEDINQMYNSLKNKKDMVKHIYIMPDYSLRLSGFDDSTVPVEFISEGEKGVLMYSVMYGLLNISESKLPLIIDSPLGRMDSDHVNNLITKLYPVFGNQVIILSHDREITSSSLHLLDSVLAKTYLLKNTYPKINPGYFE